MSASLKSIGAITLFVEDLQLSKQFYQDIFDLKVIYEDDNSAVVGFENTMVNLLHTSQAPELITPAPVADSDAGSRMQFSIWVDDTDAVCALLAKQGVPLLNGPVDRPWGKRTAAFADPAGNVWEVAQDLP